MKFPGIILLSIVALAAIGESLHALASSAGFPEGELLNDAPRFEVGKGTFLFNGEPYVIKAAELHYPR
ncbi:MAG: hypothetical protein K2K47_02130, partial [Duncaniella sp.]|nr:hypothetical protein [Duncaniella sp.]